MLVNAQQFPGPALWQGIMMIVAIAWAAWLLMGDRSPRAVKWSLAGVLGGGVALFVALI